MHTLRDTPRRGGRVLLTGGTGYLGGLLAAQLVHDGWADRMVMPIRRTTATAAVPERIRNELAALGADVAEACRRFETVPWQGAETATAEALRELLERQRIDTIIHCAGCLDYFDEDALAAINVDFTTRLADAARAAGVKCFAYVSSAYSAGYCDRPIPEAALAEPHRDPTCYTRTKRAAEHAVARSGVPFVIVRPSIVIGDSRNGRYSGKRYGLYQQWMGIERLLSDRYHAELHTVATDQPVNLLHQDAFQAATAGILRRVPDGAYVNLVTRNHLAPSMKALWRLICEVTRPRRVVFYPGLQHVNLRTLDIRQRSYLTFARTNLEIGAHPWRFEHRWLDLLRERGLNFVDTSTSTLRVCQDRFLQSSVRLQRYLADFAPMFPEAVEYLDYDAGRTGSTTASHEFA